VDIVDKKKISAIPQSTQKFMTFSIGNLKFLDTAQFMPDRLETLEKENLKTNNEDRYDNFNSMKQHFNNEELKLICQKGVYPYEYMDNIENNKDTELPPIKAFYSKLRLSGISREAYRHAQIVYHKFKCQTFQDYHDLYLKADVLLLSDVFENFRKPA
jgi:hypothetical protein